MTELLRLFAPPADEATTRSTRVDDTKRLLSRADPIAGVSGHLDTLLTLADSLDPSHLDDRLREAEALVRGIPELAPLAGLRAIWSGESKAGGGAPVRRTAMALWTLPYFVDAALLAPERDSVPDDEACWHDASAMGCRLTGPARLRCRAKGRPG